MWGRTDEKRAMVVIVRAHITLKPEYLGDPEAMTRVCNQLSSEGLQNISRALLGAYGVISADVDEDALPRLAELEGVLAVEADRHNRPMSAGAGAG